jgi:hypothetical protein
MKPEHRARLLELAASRGENGFSNVVAEALELYFRTRNRRKKVIQNALALKGSLSKSEAADLLARTRAIRENWR